MHHLILQHRITLLEAKLAAAETRIRYEHKHVIGITDAELDRLTNDEGYEILHSQFLQSFNRTHHGTADVKHCVTLRRIKPNHPTAPPPPTPPPAPDVTYTIPPPPAPPQYNMHADYDDALRAGYPASVLMKIAERDARQVFVQTLSARRAAPTRPSFMQITG